MKWAIRSALSKSVKVGYERYSETERVLVCNDELAILNMLKIQSDPTGNFWDLSGDEIKTRSQSVLKYRLVFMQRQRT